MSGNVGQAKRLRRNQTDAERVLWFQPRDRRLKGLKFELDGGQHATRTAEDANRTKILEAFGYLVLRFWNNDVLQNTEGVLEEILSTVKQHRSEPPHPDPLPCGERAKKA